ncbi:YceI family protein [Marinobacterium sp. YM272]|uniref:YceI family protein n=1 Tax=Marinobacterium sp. YM272 TaxID=3421654 RepID=UPI003D7FC208
MNVKKLFGAGLLAASLSTTGIAQAAPEAYAMDMAHSTVVFNINHLGFSNMFGRFDQFDGDLNFDADNIENSSVNIVIDTESVNTFHGKRNEHLASPDFFNAAEFPEMTFESTKITKTGDNTAKLEGDLTLLGVTKPVTLDLVVNNVGPHPFTKQPMAGFSATGTVKRSEFGMNYGLPAIGDEVHLQIEVEATPK